MGERDVELAGAEHPPRRAAEQEPAEPVGVGPPQVGHVADRVVGEGELEDRAVAEDLHADAEPGRNLGHPALQLSGGRFQPLVDAGAAQDVQRGHAGRRAQRVAVEGVAEVGAGLAGAAVRMGDPDDLPRPGNSGHRHAVGERLAERRQVRDDPVAFLGPAEGEPEAGHHLVEDEQHPALRGDLPQHPQEPGGRHQAPLHRLADHRSQIRGVTPDQLLGQREVVPAGHDHIVGGGSRHPVGVGARMRVLRGLREGVHHPHVVNAVESAGELQDLGPAGERSGHPQRVEGGLGARRGELHLLGARHHVHDPGRKLDGRRVEHVEG